MKIYHYTIRYSFEDRKKKEAGYGVLCYSSLKPLDNLSFDEFGRLEREIALSRNHQIVSIMCYSLNKAEIIK